MMEVLTKKFWQDAKRIFDEARREDAPAVVKAPKAVQPGSSEPIVPAAAQNNTEPAKSENHPDSSEAPLKPEP